MAIDPNIKEKANDIRNKIYGKEVRESLASGLEGMSEDVESIKGRQDTVETTFQEVIDETTDKDVISAPELIAARNGKSNLKTRLDEEHAEVTAQLQQTATDLNQERINVLNHGVIGDGIKDDTQALKDLISELTLSDTLFFPRGYRFKVSDTIHFPRKLNIIMESSIVYAGNEHIPIIVVGEKGLENQNVRLELMAEKESVSDWDNNNSKSIQVINLYDSHLIIRKTRNTTIGVELIGWGSGFVYNTILMYDMYAHKIGLKLTNEKHNNRVGWVNENLFINGRFGQYSGQKINQSRYGVVITSEDQTYTNNNNNLFIKPSFELNVNALETSGEAIPIVIEHGSQNEFTSIRNESNSITTARFMNSSTENYVSVGYGRGFIEDVSHNTMNYITSRRINYSSWTQIFNSGSLAKRATVDDNRVSFDNVNVISSTAGNPTDSGTNITVNENNIIMDSSRGVSVRLHTRDIGIIAVKRDVSAMGRVAVIAYDGQGNRLTGSNPRYIKSQASVSLSPNSIFGGSYQTGSDYNGVIAFSTNEEVAYVDIIITKGELRGFTIEVYGGSIDIPYKV